jgi:hypothetical protein
VVRPPPLGRAASSSNGPSGVTGANRRAEKPKEDEPVGRLGTGVAAATLIDEALELRHDTVIATRTWRDRALLLADPATVADGPRRERLALLVRAQARGVSLHLRLRAARDLHRALAAFRNATAAAR